VVSVFLNQNKRLRALNDRVEHVNLALEQRAAEAELATLAKSRFLSSMSHELRTPLNAVIGISEMLHEEASDAGQDDLAEAQGRVVRAGRHLQGLIDDVLDLSKIEAGRVELNPVPLNLHSLFEDIDMTTRQLALEGNNQLTVSVEGSPGDIHMDPLRLRQIVINLISNACKFTKGGEISVIATVEGIPAAALRIEVADSGVGIGAQDLESIFEEFSQSGSAEDKRAGTGLGLTITRRLCRLMGGDVEAVSEPGVGSVFTATLPAQPPTQVQT